MIIFLMVSSSLVAMDRPPRREQPQPPVKTKFVKAAQSMLPGDIIHLIMEEGVSVTPQELDQLLALGAQQKSSPANLQFWVMHGSDFLMYGSLIPEQNEPASLKSQAARVVAENQKAKEALLKLSPI